MEKIRKIKFEKYFLLLCFSVFCILFINRFFYAIDMADEAYYCTTGYRLIKGNIPFADMWEPTAGSSFIMAPFLCLRSFFFSNGEGIVLYLRICYFLLSSLPAFAIYQYAKLTIDKSYALLLSLMFLFYAPFQLVNFSYNNLAITFTTLSLCMLFIGLKIKKNIYYYLAGINISLAILSYPTVIYLSGVLFFVLFIAGCFKPKSFLGCLYYLFGGLSVGIPAILYLSYNAGIGNLFTNLYIIATSTNSPYSKVPILSYVNIFQKLYGAVIYFKTMIVNNGNLFLVYWLLMIVALFTNKAKNLLKYSIIFYPLLCCYCCTIYIEKKPVYIANRISMFFIFSIMLLILIAVTMSKNHIKDLKRTYFEWTVSILLYFILAVSSGGGARNAICGLVFTSIISVKLILQVNRKGSEPEPQIKFDRIETYLFLLLIIGCEIFAYYKAPFFDANIPNLTAKVESGIYKGIYTTPERKKYIEDLGSVMEKLEDKNETVMILYHNSYAYLMVDMIPKTPTSWGCIYYPSNKIDNQDLFLNYLKSKSNVPKNILIINAQSQQIKSYEQYYPLLSKFITNHYLLAGTYEQGLSGKVMKYKLKQY